MSAASESAPGPGIHRVVALVCAAHFFSHFYMLLLPPLFPLMRADFEVGFTELGLAMTVYSLTTGLTQAPVGFLVDRYGARSILVTGLLAQSLAVALIGLFPGYATLLLLMVVSGLGNAVYHPCNYSILNAAVPSERMGRAFSLHTFSGLLGAAVAPGLVVTLAGVARWQDAVVICGVGGTLLALVLALNSGALARATLRESAPAQPGAATAHGLRLLFSPAVLMATAFFVGLAMFGAGITAFGISALEMQHPGELSRVAFALSVYLFASPLGVLLGGRIADRIARHDRFVALCLVTVACAAFLIAGLRPGLTTVTLILAVAGLASGIVSPSRDMMVRALAPPGSAGKVFGFVSTGFNVGGILAPPLFGLLLDHGRPHQVFWVVGLLALATVATVLVTGEKSRARHAHAALGAD